MAFPDDVTVFVRAQNPVASDLAQITEYQSLLNAGNFADAASYLAQWPKGIQMNINAGRFNEVLSAVESIEEFYLGLGGVKEYIDQNVTRYRNIAPWSSTIFYKVGNIAAINGVWYRCILDIPPLPSNPSLPLPTNPSSIIGARYWQLFLKPQPAKQYPISATEPVGQNEGDLWFQVISSS